MQIILISGFAGAGKSTALKILEDNGYYCIDNLPPPLLIPLIETYGIASPMQKIAISVDTRSRSLLRQLPHAIQKLNELKIENKIIFLEAQHNILIKRYSETRRKHPLSDGKKTINDCIIEEQELLYPIGNIAHRIDTSDLSANELRRLIKQIVDANSSPLHIVLQSFGFKYGLPIDSDFIFDVRCLPNPFYNSEIREFTGLDEPIINFLAKQPLVNKMIDDIYNMVSPWLNEFSQDNRHFVTISIGCTGGKHRSVYIAEQLTNLLTKYGYKTMVRHRQIHKDNKINNQL